jgi:peptide/nickel transport system ATP-binding protein
MGGYCEILGAMSDLLEVKGLKVQFGSSEGLVCAVDGVSFSVPDGSTFALVGESGCGKSVTALSLARLVPEPAGSYAAGSIMFNGENVLEMSNSRLRELRGSEIAYVFQEPSTALNPVFRVGAQIMEAIQLHRKDVDARDEAIRLMSLVGLPDPAERMKAYPHELSGGMQQRVMIAMALACSPKLLVADEPTTALDVTIQAQILDLLASLQKKLNMSVLLITHNLGLVADVAHTVNVMYAGRIVESGQVSDVLAAPEHPYTRGLLDAVPKLSGIDGSDVRLEGIDGLVPNPAELPIGCKFEPRCKYAQDKCREVEPELECRVSKGGGATANSQRSTTNVQQPTSNNQEKGRLVRCHYPLGGSDA